MWATPPRPNPSRWPTISRRAGWAAGAGTLWITHAGVQRAASLLERGIRCIGRADQWPRAAPGFGQWRMLALAPNDRPEPAGFNEQGG